MLDKGANVNAITTDHAPGTTPLLLASCNGHEEIARLLLEEGADANAAMWQC